MKNKRKNTRNFMKKRNEKQLNVIYFDNKINNKKIYKKTRKNKINIKSIIDNKSLKRVFLFMCLALILITFSITEYNLNKRANNYKIRVAEMEERYKKAQEQSEYLDEYKEYVNTKEYKEIIAREKLGLVYDDEIIFKIKE